MIAEAQAKAPTGWYVVVKCRWFLLITTYVTALVFDYPLNTQELLSLTAKKFFISLIIWSKPSPKVITIAYSKHGERHWGPGT